MSRTGRNWTTISTHTDDTALSEPGSTLTWTLHPPHASDAYRYLRIQQCGKNASAQTHYLSLSGLEIYGKVGFNLLLFSCSMYVISLRFYMRHHLVLQLNIYVCTISVK